MKRFKISYIFGIPKANRDQGIHKGKNKEARNKKRRGKKKTVWGFVFQKYGNCDSL